MVDITKFTKQKQNMAICVIYSLWRVLSYSCKMSLHDFCIHYIQLINTKCPEINSKSFFNQYEIDIRNKRYGDSTKCNIKKMDGSLTDILSSIDYNSLEYLTTSVFHYYCQKIENNIRGYQHIKNLIEESISNNSCFKKIKICNVDCLEIPSLTEAQLKLSSNKVDFLLLLIDNQKGGHSVVVTMYQNVFYICDPNIGTFKRIEDYQHKNIVNPFENEANWDMVSEYLEIKLT